jgi:hypothetical protein
MKGRGWIDLSWHPVAARICVGDPPPRIPDTFTFSEQLRHQLSGLALVSIAPVSSWERVIDLQFAKRPGEPALWHLWAEIMGKYSNVILTAQDNLVVTCAHQVSAKQSTVRPIQTGQPYEMPPSLTTVPTRGSSGVRTRRRRARGRREEHASPRQSSPMPGAVSARRRPRRRRDGVARTRTSVPSGNTVSRWPGQDDHRPSGRRAGALADHVPLGVGAHVRRPSAWKRRASSRAARLLLERRRRDLADRHLLVERARVRGAEGVERAPDLGAPRDGGRVGGRRRGRGGCARRRAGSAGAASPRCETRREQGGGRGRGTGRGGAG